ncbi:MAG: formylglycine-generating enzyme family protein [Treponema sp.]|nr:formylglycine-generating enzyme family protein [Treponema sp.]
MRKKQTPVEIKTRAQQPETEDRVKLKPFLGVRPGIYLAVLYSILFLLIFFLILILPGLRKHEALIQLKTEPFGAALRVDGIYRGTSTDKIFVSKGLHTLEAALPGFETKSMTREIPGRVFGSLFFPLRYPVEFTLKSNDPARAFADAAADYAAWSFGGEPTGTWQIPLSLSEGAYRIGPSYNPALAELLAAAARFTVTRAALRDLIRAKTLLDNGGLSPSPASIANSVSGILQFLSENAGSADWLSSLLPPESASVIKKSNWRNNYGGFAGGSAVPQAPLPAMRLELAGLSFVSANGIMISENQVPQPVYDAFLEENPQWKEDADPDFFPQTDITPEGVTGVSWFAADAFCKWIGKELPSSMAGWEARLPTEAEWDSAAGLAEADGWEWCQDPYVPLPFIKTKPGAAKAVGSPERSLRGRAYPETRASLPPDFSSPFVSFRPVIAPLNGAD